MAYAVIRLGGRQFKITEGMTFEIERQSALLPEVLAFSDENGTVLGAPVLTDVTVTLTNLEDYKGPKIRIGRFKSKSRYTRTKGHRQPFSKIKVESIDVKGVVKKVAVKEPKKTEEVSAPKASKKPISKKVTKKVKKA